MFRKENGSLRKIHNKITWDKTIKKLENLPSVEDFSEEDRKFYSEIGRAILINELDSLIGAKKLSIGVIMAASMLEFAGKIRLLWKFKKSVANDKIYNLNFAMTIMGLFASKIVDKDTYDKMEKIKDTRNKLAHNLLIQLSTSLDTKNNSDLESLIKDSIDIIKILFA